MLTVDFEQFPIEPGELVLDMGCGGGRHAFSLYKQGARVVALDMDAAELKDVAGMFDALRPEVPASATAAAVRGDAYRLPFADATFDKVIAAEILEHLPSDTVAMAEMARVLRLQAQARRQASMRPRKWPRATGRCTGMTSAVLTTTPTKLPFPKETWRSLYRGGSSTWEPAALHLRPRLPSPAARYMSAAAPPAAG